MIQITAHDSLRAWERLNELFLLQPKDLIGDNPDQAPLVELTNSWYRYDIFLKIVNPEMDPNFDYAKYFHFSQHKWSKLIGNYLNLDSLDELRDYVRQQELDLVKNRHYSVSANFDNAHSNGKSCITHCTITHTLVNDKPEITIIMRAAEVTTRFAVDLNFIYRFGEYIFGHKEFTISIFIKQAMALENLLVLYTKYRSIRKLRKVADDTKILDQVEARLKDMKESTEEKYKTYAVFYRPYKIIHSETYPTPKPLLAGSMVIGNWEDIQLPKSCPTVMERNAFKAAYDKFVRKYGIDIFKEGKREKVLGNSISLASSIDSEPDDDSLEE